MEINITLAENDAKKLIYAKHNARSIVEGC